MNALTAEWVEKAEEDYMIATHELVAQAYQAYNGVCFHAQQSAEKYLKGFLQEQGIPFPKTHELPELLALCLPYDTSFGSLRASLDSLVHYAVDYRYPGASANKDEAQEAVKNLELVRTFTRKKLGLG